MATLSLGEIAGAVGGQLFPDTRTPGSAAQERIAGYSIDSRSVRPGDLFFALVGPCNDGHRFVDEVVTRGAAALVVARDSGEFPGSPALVRVKDTTRALQDLGSYLRRRRRLKVIGITGSAGKTTAKEMTAAVVGERFRTHPSEGNLNNTYGLPLTLLRMPDETEAAVLEMGMSYQGEITRLVEIADPDIGVILNVLRVHLEHFGSLDRIARAKGELFRTMRHDSIAIFNADDAPTSKLGRSFRGERIPFGITSKAAAVRADRVELEGISGSRFQLWRGSEHAAVRLGMPGRHNIYNALAAASVGFSLGIAAEAIGRRLESVRPAAMRGVLYSLPNGVELLDDSYNSNPAAMKCLVELLRDLRPRGRRILVSGDMLELGSHGKKAHAQIGCSVAESGIDIFVAVGPLSALAADAARSAGGRIEVHHFTDSAVASPFVAGCARDGDLVVIKGSRGIAMERIVLAVREAAGSGSGTGGVV